MRRGLLSSLMLRRVGVLVVLVLLMFIATQLARAQYSGNQIIPVISTVKIVSIKPGFYFYKVFTIKVHLPRQIALVPFKTYYFNVTIEVVGKGAGSLGLLNRGYGLVYLDLVDAHTGERIMELELPSSITIVNGNVVVGSWGYGPRASFRAKFIVPNDPAFIKRLLSRGYADLAVRPVFNDTAIVVDAPSEPVELSWPRWKTVCRIEYRDYPARVYFVAGNESVSLPSSSTVTTRVVTTTIYKTVTTTIKASIPPANSTVTVTRTVTVYTENAGEAATTQTRVVRTTLTLTNTITVTKTVTLTEKNASTSPVTRTKLVTITKTHTIIRTTTLQQRGVSPEVATASAIIVLTSIALAIIASRH